VCLSDGKRIVRPVYGGSEPRRRGRRRHPAPHAREGSLSAGPGLAGDEAR
jgi:hypothetical protein